MSDSRFDLPNDEFAALADRIERRLEQYVAAPEASLRYRLAEVGRYRTDARVLRRVLLELANNRRPRRGAIGGVGPWEPYPGMFVLGERHPEVATRQAAEVDAAFAGIAASDSATIAQQVERVIADMGESYRIDSVDDRSSATRAVGSRLEMKVTDLTVSIAGLSRSTVWVSHDLEWIYPDDHRLWRHLFEASSMNARPLIVARKIAPATFPLLKALGAFATQYYAYVSEASAPNVQHLKDHAGWMPTIHAAEWGQQVGVRRLAGALNSELAGDIDEINQAIDLARSMGLDRAAVGSAARLHEWSSASGVLAHTGWIDSVEQWMEFENYRRRGNRSDARPRRRSNSDSADSRVDSGVSRAEERRSQALADFGRKTEKSRIPINIR